MSDNPYNYLVSIGDLLLGFWRFSVTLPTCLYQNAFAFEIPNSMPDMATRNVNCVLLFVGRCDPNAVNDQGRTPLMLAVEMDDIRMIRRLIKAGAPSFSIHAQRN